MARLPKITVSNVPIARNIDDKNVERKLRQKWVSGALERAIKLKEFYEENPTEMIMQKYTDQILGAMRQEYVFEARLPDSEIVAAAVTWNTKLPVYRRTENKHEVVEFLEAGTMRSILNCFNLQAIMHSVRLLDALLKLDRRGSCFFCATYGDNEASKQNLSQNIGYAPWRQPHAELQSLREHALADTGESSRGVAWFKPHAVTVLNAAKRLAPYLNNGAQTIDQTQKRAKRRNLALAKHDEAQRTSVRDGLLSAAEQKLWDRKYDKVVIDLTVSNASAMREFVNDVASRSTLTNSELQSLLSLDFDLTEYLAPEIDLQRP